MQKKPHCDSVVRPTMHQLPSKLFPPGSGKPGSICTETSGPCSLALPRVPFCAGVFAGDWLSMLSRQFGQLGLLKVAGRHRQRLVGVMCYFGGKWGGDWLGKHKNKLPHFQPFLAYNQLRYAAHP